MLELCGALFFAISVTYTLVKLHSVFHIFIKGSNAFILVTAFLSIYVMFDVRSQSLLISKLVLRSQKYSHKIGMDGIPLKRFLRSC